jgi:putative transposase
MARYASARVDDQKYAHLITDESQFLKDVPSQILRNGAARFFNGLKRFKAGLGGAPTVQSRHGRQSVLITNELFRFEPVPGQPHSKRRGCVIELGTRANPIGTLPFIAHRDWEVPKQIVISVEPDGKWFVSFSYESSTPDDQFIERTPDELVYELQGRDDLEEVVWAGDRGVSVPLMGSDGTAFDFSEVQKARLTRAEQQKRKYQRRMARCQKQRVDGRLRVSKGYLKLKKRAARHAAYCRDVRQDFAHQTSHRLVSSDTQVFAFEDLNIKNMTAAPAPKQDADGRWAPNGSAAKAGLNAAILRSAWGLVQRFTTYKTAKCNKLVYVLNPAYSSQTCAECGHKSADNRKTQSLFSCVASGHTDNADCNSARVLKAWTVQKVRDGEAPSQKKKKRVAFQRKSKDLPNSALEQELLEVTSESGACQPSPAATAANGALLRCSA